MKNRQKVLLAAAIAGLMVSSSAMAGAAFPGQDSMKKGGSCDLNGCKGKGGCKGTGSCKSGHACKGKGACGASCSKSEGAKMDGGTLNAQ